VSTVLSYDYSGVTWGTSPEGRKIPISGEPKLVLPQQLAPSGSVTLAVDAATRTYTLTVTAGAFSFPSGSMVMPANSPLGYERNWPDLQGTPAELAARGDMIVSTVPAGTGSSGAIRALTTFMRLYNVGQVGNSPRYLSAGQWGQFYQENPSGNPGPESFNITQQSFGTMVFGQRTTASETPLNGTARYQLNSFFAFTGCNNEETDCSDFKEERYLDADFEKSRLSAVYLNQYAVSNYETDDEGNAILDADGNPKLIDKAIVAVDTKGSAPFSAGADFAIALTGKGSVHTVRTDNAPVPDISKPVTGSINGAFFGPQAVEVGGVWNLPTIAPDGTVGNYYDAFYGKK